MISTTDMSLLQNPVVDGPMADRLLDDYQRVCCTVHGATVTPEGAAVFNRRNIANIRKFNGAHAEMLAVEMERGRFEFNGIPISFDTQGILLNGQHRLDACMRSRAPFMTNIVFGLKPGTQRKTDIGQLKRGADAVLRDMNVPSYGTASTICRDTIACIRNKTFARSVAHVSESEIGEFYKAHRAEIDDAVQLTLHVRNVFKASELGAVFLFLVKLRQKAWAKQLVNLVAGDAPARRVGATSAFARFAWKYNAGGYTNVDGHVIRRVLLAACNTDWIGKKCDGNKPFELAEADRLGATLQNRFPQEIITRG